MNHDRRNDYDVTNTVQVSNPTAVRDAVHELFAEAFPGASFDKLWLAFYDFERLFTGRFPGYHGCDTTYHDMQHTLDMTLALARLVVGYERSVEPSDRLGPRRAQMALITSLFHDSGYIRHESRDEDFRNGAEFTMYHVSRSADFLRRYLPELGRESVQDSAVQRLTRKLFHDSPALLMARLLGKGSLTDHELRELRDMVDARLAEGGDE